MSNRRGGHGLATRLAGFMIYMKCTYTVMSRLSDDGLAGMIQVVFLLGLSSSDLFGSKSWSLCSSSGTPFQFSTFLSFPSDWVAGKT